MTDLQSTYFLRVPPFPRARPVSPAVDNAPRNAPLNMLATDESPSEVRRRLLSVRVGGEFWAPPMPHTGAAIHILCPQTLAQAKGMHAALIASGAFPWRAIVPTGREGKRIKAWLQQQGGRVDYGPVDPWSILDGAVSLFVSAGDERAIVAQIAGVPVRHFTVADGREIASPPVDPLTVIEAVLLANRHYHDCFTGAPCAPIAMIDQLTAWRTMIDGNRKIAAAAGIADWKRQEIETFLWAGQARQRLFYRSAANAVQAAGRAKGAIAVWPSRVPASVFSLAKAASVPICQIEDGFIRSVGLGSGLHPPQSVVVDPIGIYYDPTQPSALEVLLETMPFPQSLIDRASALVAMIVASGISKYAAGHDRPPESPATGRRVLVTGQVEDDRSVLLGGGDVRGNFDLLRRARAHEPDSFLIFKPHPDVEAGHRKGAISDRECLKFADLVVRDVSMAAMLEAVDAVHVWTSLAGFEALLRRREVIVHGQPFFAGWGLTQDLAGALPRRTRRLSLMELVAGSLLVYPQYLDPVTKLPCTPELLISRMAQPSFQHQSLLTRVRALQGQVNRWFR
ncbi:MAG: hypothetical protein B7Y49_13380 [Sphingomonas sp. 28-62-11]|nr:MAG: hypothetical protein B7Y49_13380 [Sphingomonas sp. 28-62-11]